MASRTVTYYAALATDEDGAQAVADRSGWTYESELSRLAPPNLQIISIEQKVDRELENLAATGHALSRQLDEQEAGAAALATTFHPDPTITMGSHDDPPPPERWEVNLLPSELVTGGLVEIIDAALGQSTPPPSPDSGSGTPAPDANAKPKAGADPLPPPAADTAASITAAFAALPDPAKLWEYLGAEEKAALAKTKLEETYADRHSLAERSEWLVAPDLVLLDTSPEAERPQLAAQLLRVRAGLTDADAKKRDAGAALEEKRVALAGVGVEIATEMLAHMKKWRDISKWGLWALLATSIFSAAAVAYTLMYLVPGGKIGEVATPIVIFALALFAISPAVLLLRERPLEGLDKWSPSGGEKAAGAAKEAAAGVKEAGKKDAGAS